MVVIVQLCIYVLAFALLSLVALERARRCGHAFTDWIAGAFGLAGAAASVICAVEGTSTYALFIALACVAVCATTDLTTGLIYDSVVNTTIIAIAALSLSDPLRALVGAAAGYTLAFALHALTRGWGLGFGDVKLFGVSGAALGFAGALACFGAAFVLGAMFSLFLLASARIKRTSGTPFAPYIAVATMVLGCIYR